VKDHTWLLREERSTHAVPMEEAPKVNLQENGIIVSFTNGAQMEEAWEASSKENIIIS
jgi:hypothetical protein